MAALLMQALDGELAEISERWMHANQASDVVVVQAEGTESHETSEGNNGKGDIADGIDEHHHPSHGDETHGHSHLAVRPPADMGHVRKVISAICMEFGVTFHSIFVGVAVGLTTNTELKPLMVALFFHQLFEGMALGSRLVDAKFGDSLERGLAVMFAVSAPLGMVVSTIAVSVSKDAISGGKFVTTLAILNSFCGGILLYLAFNLLLNDFTSDMKAYGARGEGKLKRKIILYVALWTGMLLMALVGKWL
ncbi:solute carrier family 39 (zinc transporter), member 1/2/3 [Angomonas deanei]|nr:solute carrier family 39 (zinc transporter), member 1/2/3 [Angomonas deanei]|eukprot:EPY28359.1 solute carrier family 39 (zinc transporter), member 1/2/3 [Angomonas deanei]